MILIFVIAALFGVAACIGESYYERDWPTTQAPYAMAALVLLVFGVAVLA